MKDQRRQIIGRFMRGECTEADVKAALEPSPLVAEVLEEQRAGRLRRWYGETEEEERAALDFEERHSRAIDVLQAAEEYLCPVRASVLWQIGDTLDPAALPVDFFPRLIRLQKRISELGRKRRRTAERDQWLRFEWGAMRGESVWRQWLESKGNDTSYDGALSHLADAFGKGRKAIEAVVGSSGGPPRQWKPVADYDRLEQVMALRYPKKSRQTSR